MPLACSLPKIWDGFGSFTLFHTMDAAEGCLKIVVSPAAMLKVFQLRKAFCEAVMVSCEPLWLTLADPDETVRPVGLASAFAARPNIMAVEPARRGLKLRQMVLINFINGHTPPSLRPGQILK